MSKILPRLGLPNLGFGVGLRATHFPYLMQHSDPLVDWFEIISENFMDNYGYARHVLERMASKRPIVMHGVSLNIGSTDPLNFDYLKKLKELAVFIKPTWVSDHLCWTGVAHVNSHDLLPLPLNEESLKHVIAKVKQVQDFLERPLVLENPSTYLSFNSSSINEWDFLAALAQEADCGLLLDVNNVYVSAYNHGYDAVHYIKSLPANRIVQLHVAGPTHVGDCLIDTHDHPVPSDVWELYRLAQQLTGGVSTLLEWDAKIPTYPELVAELNKAKAIMQGKSIEKIGVNNQQEAIAHPIDFHLNEVNQV